MLFAIISFTIIYRIVRRSIEIRKDIKRQSGPPRRLNSRVSSMMTTVALCAVFHVESSLAIVAGPAELAFGHLAHVHLVRSLFHLEDPKVTTRAFVAVRCNVFLMVENDRRRTLGLISYRATTDQNLRYRAERQHEAKQDCKNDTFSLHGTSSFSYSYARQLPCSLGMFRLTTLCRPIG
jgi:hypothetical protein